MFIYSKTRSNVIKTFLKHNFNSQSKRNIRETHYDVLGLRKNCSTKDIREAFLKLSKKYHPDKSNEHSTEKEFVKVLEAYSVLSKPTSRRQYDWEIDQISIRYPPRSNPSGMQEPYPASRSRGYGYDDPSFWANRDKTRDRFYRNNPYYGVQGVPRVPNGIIALMCIVITVIGASLQYFAIRHSVTLKRDFLKQRSDNNESILAEVRSDAANNDKHFQIELVERRLMDKRFDYDTKD